MVLNVGCSEQPPLSGTVSMGDEGEWKPMVYLLDPGSWGGIGGSFAGTVLDSAIIREDGQFAFATMPDAPEPMLLELAVQRKEGAFFANRLDNESPTTANYFPIVWKNGEAISISAAAAHFQKTFSMKKPFPGERCHVAVA
ncbi:MAG: hypothetical protein IPM82_02770 [Saprospiraceae bacterium]|nr:hypothetical protein [Saprospiraceae bacterium]